MDDRKSTIWADIGLLLFRIAFGGMMLLGHGWGKLANFGEKAVQFPSVLGLGSASTLGLAVFAEFFCALALILGLASRLALIPLIVTMAVAAFVIHGVDPFGKKELALVYLCAYIGIFFIGPGRYSLDTVIAKKWRS